MAPRGLLLSGILLCMIALSNASELTRCDRPWGEWNTCQEGLQVRSRIGMYQGACTLLFESRQCRAGGKKLGARGIQGACKKALETLPPCLATNRLPRNSAPWRAQSAICKRSVPFECRDEVPSL